MRDRIDKLEGFCAQHEARLDDLTARVKNVESRQSRTWACVASLVVAEQKRQGMVPGEVFPPENKSGPPRGDLLNHPLNPGRSLPPDEVLAQLPVENRWIVLCGHLDTVNRGIWHPAGDTEVDPSLLLCAERGERITEARAALNKMASLLEEERAAIIASVQKEEP